MKISNLIIAILFLFCSYTVVAQSPQRLEAEGKIPKEFITPSTVKFEKDVAKLTEKKGDKKETKSKKQFLLESNFSIDDVLQSGVVLFNDPASIYVNEVLKKLPFDDAKLKDKNPRAYILNSAAVNAFATDQGIIFVTLGLLANLQNEAQLAFILSHELMHIKHKHAIDKFIKSKEIDRKGRNREQQMDDIGIDANFFKKSLYSRQLEEEADEKGFEVFLKSDYDPEVILNIFKILHYSYLPFEDYPFEKSFFEDEYFIFPEENWLEKTNPISPMEDNEEEEEKSSHPSSTKRLAKLKDKIDSNKDSNKKAYLLPEASFKSIQANARYQIPFLNLYAENFPEAIYTSYMMLNEYPDDLALKKVIGKALYMEAKYKNYEATEGGSREDRLIEITEEMEGEVQQVYHLLSTLSYKEMTVLALKYNWTFYQKNKEEEEIKLLIDDLFTEFAEIYEDLDGFATMPPIVKTAEEIKAEENEKLKKEEEKKKVEEKKKHLSKLDKIDNIEEEEEEAQPIEDYDFWELAFINEIKTEDFNEFYKKGLEEIKKREEKNDFYYSRIGRKQRAKKRKRERRKGKQLGIDKIAVINPFYVSIDERKREGKIQYIRAEEKQIFFRQAIKDLAKKSKLETTVLDVTDLTTNDIEKFNDIAKLNRYFGQQMDHYDLTLTPGYDQAEINAIAKRYDTDYFLWTGVIAVQEKGGGWFPVIASILQPYFLPFTIANAVTPEYDMLYYAILFDVKTGRRSILKMDYFDKRDSNTILKAHIYDVFHQIKK